MRLTVSTQVKGMTGAILRGAARTGAVTTVMPAAA